MPKEKSTVKSAKKSVKKTAVKKSTAKSVKKVSKKPVTKRKVVRKKNRKVLNDIHEAQPVVSNVCRSCNMLPVGSVELVTVLLMLIFSLSAVLVTSVYALNQQSSEISDLQAQLNVQKQG